MFGLQNTKTHELNSDEAVDNQTLILLNVSRYKIFYVALTVTWPNLNNDLNLIT